MNLKLKLKLEVSVQTARIQVESSWLKCVLLGLPHNGAVGQPLGYSGPGGGVSTVRVLEFVVNRAV